MVERYLELGLRLGRLLDGLVDAYYGPPTWRAASRPSRRPDPAKLAADARRLIADLDSGAGGDDIDAHRRRWIRGQVVACLVTARRFAGESIGFVDEVEQCYGVRPDARRRRRDRRRATPHRRGVAGNRPARRASHRVARGADRSAGQARGRDRLAGRRLPRAHGSDVRASRRRAHRLRARDERAVVGLQLLPRRPAQPGRRSTPTCRCCRHRSGTSSPTRPIRDTTPNTRGRKSASCAGAGQLEETIFLVGTPQCLLAEGLADLGIEVIVPDRRHETVAEHLRPLGIPYDAEVATAVAEAGELLGNAVRGNVAIALHEDGMSPDDAVAYVERFGLLPHNRAQKVVEFQTDPTWRAYIFCYIDGLRLCRRYVDGRPDRFARLVTESLLPDDLAAA